jgi:chemotaxis protein methyltransferase WspC
MGLDAASLGHSAIERAVDQRAAAWYAEGHAEATLTDYWEAAQTSPAMLQSLIETVVVPETWFYRDADAFKALARLAHERLAERGGALPLRILSLPCSTGEEPYTIAMTAFEVFGGDPGRPLRLLASDLSTKALTRAVAGIYKAERVDGVPRHLVLKYFEKGADLPAGTVRIAERIRRVVEFRQLNLLEAPPPGRPLDFIFCRNVLIYFDRSIQQGVVQRLEERLAPGGYLFTSHSESLNGVTHGLTWVAPAVYRRERS